MTAGPELSWGIFKNLKTGAFIKIRESGQEDVTAQYMVKESDDWQESGDHTERMKLVISGGKEGERTVFVVRDSSTNQEWIEDENSDRLEEFDGDVETVAYTQEKIEREKPRSPNEMQALLEIREVRKKTGKIFGEEGQEICEIDYIPGTLDILEIRPAPYQNIGGEAEKRNEHIYVTDDEGSISTERLMRQEARELEKRYLIVTSLIFHDQEVLLQKRSAKKDIDPGRLSSSAHGVAKELQIRNGNRVNNIEAASVINTALEINEELRHGQETEPFKVKLWPGSREELIEWADAQKIDDQDTIYLVPEALLKTDSYPLGEGIKKRTRAISTGFVFSKERPTISVDPAELSSVEWKKPSEFVEDPDMTEDLQSCLDATAKQQILESMRSGQLGDRLAMKALRNFKLGKREE